MSNEAEAARTIASEAANARLLADERTRHARLGLDAAVVARDAKLVALPDGVDASLAAAQSTLAAGTAEKETVAAEFAALERTIEARRKRIDTSLSGARTKAAQATSAVETAQGQLTAARTDHALQDGRLIELRKRRDSENLAAAETKLQETTERHAALPVPDRIVTDEEVRAAQSAASGVKLELQGIESDIQEAHGALKQLAARWLVSGCVTQPRRSSWRSVRNGKSKRNMRPGDCCSTK